MLLLHAETIYTKNVSITKMAPATRKSVRPGKTGNSPGHETYRAPLEIVKGISDIFLRYGLRSSSMDDICTHLKISKKTLYSYFDNKDQVVEAVMLYRRDRIREEDIIRQTQGIPTIRLVLGIAENISGSLRSLWPINVFDMKKYHPLVYEKMTQQDNSHIDRCMQFLFRKGWKEGIIRKDIDAAMQTEILNMQISYLADPENWPNLKHPAHLVVLHVFLNFIRSVATPEGMAELDAFLAEKGKSAGLKAYCGDTGPSFPGENTASVHSGQSGEKTEPER